MKTLEDILREITAMKKQKAQYERELEIIELGLEQRWNFIEAALAPPQPPAEEENSEPEDK